MREVLVIYYIHLPHKDTPYYGAITIEPEQCSFTQVSTRNPEKKKNKTQDYACKIQHIMVL